MKVFEYLYFGKPIVGTEIEELKRASFKELIQLNNQLDDWQKILNKTIQGKVDQKIVHQQQCLALTNSWDKKIKQILKILSNKTNI